MERKRERAEDELLKRWRNEKELIEASDYGNLDKVNRLLQDKNVDPSAYDNQAIIKAVNSGHIDIVNRLLEDRRVDPSEAIGYAIANRQLRMVKRLLQDKRVNPAMDNNSAIFQAIHSGQTNIVERLLEDPRVEWRRLRGTRYEYLLDERKQNFRNSLLPILGGFRQKIPGSSAAREHGKRAAFEMGMKMLCKDVRTGAIPSIELLDLIRMLRETRYLSPEEADALCNNRDKKIVCDRIREALTEFQLDQWSETSPIEFETKKRRIG